MSQGRRIYSVTDNFLALHLHVVDHYRGEIDVVALAGRDRGPVLVGETKRSRRVDGARIRRVLERKASAITGQPDELTYVVSARESVDHASGRREHHRRRRLQAAVIIRRPTAPSLGARLRYGGVNPRVPLTPFVGAGTGPDWLSGGIIRGGNPMPTLSDLGLDAAGQPWLDAADELEPSALSWPAGQELVDLLVRLGVRDDDIGVLPGLLDEVARTPELRWVAERFAAVLRARLGRPDAPRPFGDPAQTWPTLGTRWGAAGRCVYVAALLSTYDDVHRVFAARGVPADVADATLADLGRQMWVHRRVTGMTGLDTQLWMLLVWSGELVAPGRLQGERLGETAVGLHIPEAGPLTPESVDDSLRRLRDGWPRWFGSTPSEAVCESWMLDPQLAEALPKSNIAAFARRFTLDEGGYVDDASALYFVFRRRNVDVPGDLAGLPRDTSLQRVIIEHLEAGGHWMVRRGRLPL